MSSDTPESDCQMLTLENLGKMAFPEHLGQDGPPRTYAPNPPGGSFRKPRHVRSAESVSVCTTDTPAPRPKFDTLFADARHYRGDCRLVVTAIRRGWLNEAPQADRDALAARFEQVTTERWATDPDTRSVRAFFAECAVILAMDRDNTAPIHRALRYAWAGELTDRTTGRPRKRWYTTDYPNRLDAGAIQRDAERDGRNPLTIGGLTVTYRDDDGEQSDAVGVAAMPDRFRRVKLWLVCPGCKCRREHLYPVRAGVWCRKCAGIAYGA